MVQMTQLQRDIDTLPEEAQNLLLDFVELLKRRYQPISAAAQIDRSSNFDRFEQIGFMGCCDVEEDLSVNYKPVLADLLESKYDYR
jgi:uncharacterized protein YfbU (UPF0304 family)